MASERLTPKSPAKCCVAVVHDYVARWGRPQERPDIQQYAADQFRVALWCSQCSHSVVFTPAKGWTRQL